MASADIPPPPATFSMTPDEAIAFFRAKGLKPTFAWQDMAAGEHAKAFTIAKMMDVDLLATVRQSLDDALVNGTPFEAWAKQIQPMLEAKGWWGKKDVIDPKTGKVVSAQLGSAARLETIFRTNLQSAYAAAHWEQITAQADVAPYLMYDAIDDARTRETHRAWDGTVLPVFSEWWRTHYPPCGWQCRCSAIQLSEDELEALGLEVSREPRTDLREWTNPRTGETELVPVGVDPGFGRTPTAGKKTPEQLLEEKIKALPQDLAASANLGIEAMDKQIAREVQQRVVKQAGAAALARAEASAALAAAQAEALAAAEAEAAALAAAAQAKVDAAAAELAAAGKAAPGTIAGKTYQALAKAGALDGDPIKALSTLEQAVAEAKAAHQKGTLLGGYKSKAIAGKIPTEAQQAAFATLTEAEQEALLVEVNKAQKKAAKAAALAEAKAAQEAAQAAAAAEAAAAEAAAAEAAAQQAAAAAQEAADDALPNIDDLDIAAMVKEIEAEKAAQAAATAAEAQELSQSLSPAAKTSPVKALDGSTFTQVGPRQGTNPGGEFLDTSTGQRWYVKFPPSPEIARNEGLTANLYELAGVPVPEYRFVDIGGRRGIASRWVDNLEINSELLKGGQLDGIADGFGADAWLANWDVIGFSYDNMKVQSGARAFRVDTGGGLPYRAQGTPKGAAFGDKVLEIDSLRDARTNARAAEVFQGLSSQQITDSVRRVLRIPDAEIERVVDAWGPLELAEREALKARLLARKRDLWERFPDARPGSAVSAPAPIADAGARVTAVEQKLIEDARINGYGIRTDKDHIEDQSVLVAVMEEEGKGAFTRGNLKLLKKGDDILSKSIEEGATGVKTLASASDLDDPILELVKGINSRAAKGGALEAKTLDRWEALQGKIEKTLSDLSNVLSTQGDYMTPTAIKETVDSLVYLERWQKKLTAALRGKSATDAAVALEGVYERGKLKTITAAVEGKKGIPWVRQSGWNANLARTANGRAVLVAEQQRVPGVSVSYQVELNGVRVTYVPFEGNPSGRAFHGTLQIDVPGAGAEASGRVLEALERLGLNAERAGALDRQELFLNRLARLHTLQDDWTSTGLQKSAAYSALDQIPDQAARVKAKIAHVNKLVGEDITESDQWGTHEGVYQAFGHGRAHQYRADLDDAEFNAFEKEHVIFHNPTGLGDAAREGMVERLKLIVNGGGQLSSVSDRVRRGVSVAGGTSVSADVESGGANYVFTRIRSVEGPRRHTAAGIYWSPKQLRRLDAISYGGDKYGNTTDSVQRAARKIAINEWKSIARTSSNETIFKDGLSLFDGVEKIVMPNKSEVAEFISWLKDSGYKRWPDGRALSDVVVAP